MRVKLPLLFLLLLSVLLVPKVHAQNTNLVDSSETKLLADTGKRYIIPDTKKKISWTSFSNKLFSMQLGGVFLLDYTGFFQDSTSKAQVDKQKSQFDLRSVRLMARGKIFFKQPWQYLISIEYKGFDRDEGVHPFGFTDLMFTIPAGKLGSFSVGKLKETFVYEMVGDAANLPQTERMLSPFFASRNTGVRWNKPAFNDRMTFSAGYFNNFITSGTSFAEGVNTVTARVTGLPIYKEDGHHFIHLAASMRYLEAQNGVLRFKGKDESNVSSNYIDTKDFTAKNALSFGFEELMNYNNFSLLGEYVFTNANTPGPNKHFDGFYIEGSWVLSGETRPYDKKAAYARRVKPHGKGGAWEIVSRVSNLDFDSYDIDGGKMLKLYEGLNWWATQYWRLSVGYGFSNLDKNNLNNGTTNSIICRLQWVY
ncbi:OprO/OprP family phosphate-selective porin [Mucilaginibacter agri]|uniref:Phosphate-selective porin OprO and OprP n=1 Tax=Mucilaginibacter agri TaxID=2695265 RepID=A0A965ZJL2_9SPHI|nr:porin [Mucilaginibacter agri]NCD70836.1 hypothetical protein [Mucilaginibacter agri]